MLRSDKGQEGFTLIELMVTLVIVAVGMTAVGAMLIGDMRFNQQSEHRIDGAGIAQSVMTQALSNAQLAGYTGGTILFPKMANGQAVVTVVNGPTTAGTTAGKLIRVVFSWEEHGQLKQVELRSWAVTE